MHNYNACKATVAEHVTVRLMATFNETLALHPDRQTDNRQTLDGKTGGDLTGSMRRAGWNCEIHDLGRPENHPSRQNDHDNDFNPDASSASCGQISGWIDCRAQDD